MAVEPVVTQKRELHDLGNFQALHVKTAAAIIGMKVNAGMGLQNFRKCD